MTTRLSQRLQPIAASTSWRRRTGWRLLAAGLLAAGFFIHPALAQQDFPSRPVTIVVPFPPGSATDNVLRPLVVELQKNLGQPVVIDNKPGAQGVLATQFVTRAKPDGYTLLAGSSTTLAANVGLFKTLPYDPIKDFQPIAGLGSTMQVYLVRADSPATDLKSFAAFAQKQANPIAAGYGSSSAQVAIALLSKTTGARFTAVPYKGTQQALTDLLGGSIPMAVVDVGGALPHLKSGQLKALAVTGTARSASAPQIPTLAETHPDTELVTWIGLVAPAATPRPIVDKLYAAIAKALATNDIREKFTAVSTEVEPKSPEELSQRMKRDQVRWIELIRAAGIEPQ